MSISNYLENVLLDSGLTGTVYVKLHTADPGEDGLVGAAGETTRKGITFAAAAGGTKTSNSDAAWTNVSTSETYSHVSLWSASTAGNCLWTGPLSAAKSVNAGDNFTIPSGSLSCSLD